MSYIRFGQDNSDVYIFTHTDGVFTCCGCKLSDESEDLEWSDFNSKKDILAHLNEHIDAGHIVPCGCIERIERQEKKWEKGRKK